MHGHEEEAHEEEEADDHGHEEKEKEGEHHDEEELLVDVTMNRRQLRTDFGIRNLGTVFSEAEFNARYRDYDQDEIEILAAGGPEKVATHFDNLSVVLRGELKKPAGRVTSRVGLWEHLRECEPAGEEALVPHTEQGAFAAFIRGFHLQPSTGTTPRCSRTRPPRWAAASGSATRCGSSGDDAVALRRVRALAWSVAGPHAVKHNGRPSRFLVAAAVFALLLAAPLGVLAHEDSDQADSQCRICNASGAETAVFHDGPALPAPESDAGPHSNGVQLVPDPPATAPGAPRAPPS